MARRFKRGCRPIEVDLFKVLVFAIVIAIEYKAHSDGVNNLIKSINEQETDKK